MSSRPAMANRGWPSEKASSASTRRSTSAPKGTARTIDGAIANHGAVACPSCVAPFDAPRIAPASNDAQANRPLVATRRQSPASVVTASNDAPIPCVSTVSAGQIVPCAIAFQSELPSQAPSRAPSPVVAKSPAAAAPEAQPLQRIDGGAEALGCPESLGK